MRCKSDHNLQLAHFPLDSAKPACPEVSCFRIIALCDWSPNHTSGQNLSWNPKQTIIIILMTWTKILKSIFHAYQSKPQNAHHQLPHRQTVRPNCPHHRKWFVRNRPARMVSGWPAGRCPDSKSVRETVALLGHRIRCGHNSIAGWTLLVFVVSVKAGV